MSGKRLAWRPIEPLPAINGEIATRLEGIDHLQHAWKDVQAKVSPAEAEASLKRRLRRHAIETGIIERLYEMSWGITEALVAEGLTSEVAAAQGEVNDATLSIVRDQFEALTFLVDWVRRERDLSLHFIRQLHTIIVRHQPDYEGRDQFGRAVRIPLKPGVWKDFDNTITRSDGVILEFTPPVHVEGEMQRLVDLYRETTHAHPIVRAAWLHHRFIQIHPFPDGNGRVARALTLLALQRGHYAPVAVDRVQRNAYIEALDGANEGDLRPLVRFFARLEERALRAELQAPMSPVPDTIGALAVARAYASRLKAREVADQAVKAQKGAELATNLHRRLTHFLQNLANGVQGAFREFEPSATASADYDAPPRARAGYWHGQLVHAAKLADFYANLSDGSWWVRLNLRLRGHQMRFITAIQKVGRGETGVLALTVFAEVLEVSGADQQHPTLLFRVFEHPDVPDSVTLVYTDDADARWEEVQQVVDAALSSAISRFSEHVS